MDIHLNSSFLGPECILLNLYAGVERNVQVGYFRDFMLMEVSKQTSNHCLMRYYYHRNPAAFNLEEHRFNSGNEVQIGLSPGVTVGEFELLSFLIFFGVLLHDFMVGHSVE